MTEILIAALLSLSAAVIYHDATRNRIGKIPEQGGLFNMHAGSWAIAALFLWIIAVPAYLLKRKELLTIAEKQPVEAKRTDFKLLLLLIAGAVMFFINLGALQPDLGQSASETTENSQAMLTPTTPAHSTMSPAVEAPAPAPVTLGLGQEQILAGLESFLPPLQSSPLADGKDRLMGDTDKTKALTLVELIGHDAKTPYRVGLMMFMPSDSPVLLLGNMTVFGAITKNIFPDWEGKDRMSWLTESIKTLQETPPQADGTPQSIDKVIGDKIIRISLVTALSAVSVTIEHKDAPQ